MVSSRREERQSVSHQTAASTAKPAMSSLQPAGSNEALRITDAALSLDTQAVFEGFTGIEHRRRGKRGGPRSQPHTVWLEGEVRGGWCG